MVGSEYTYCPMCGCEDGQGCSKDCPSEVMPRLLAENAKLRAALEWLTGRLEQDFNGGEALHRWELNRARAALAQGGDA